MRFLVERNLTPDEQKKVTAKAQDVLDKEGEAGLKKFLSNSDDPYRYDNEKKDAPNYYDTKRAKEFIKSLDKKLDKDLESIYTGILAKDGCRNIDYMNYLKNSNVLDLHVNTIDTIYALFRENKLSSSDKFLYDPDLLKTEGDSATAFKIKAVAFVKAIQKGVLKDYAGYKLDKKGNIEYNKKGKPIKQPVDIIYLKNGDNWKDSNQMRYYITKNLQKHYDTGVEYKEKEKKDKEAAEDAVRKAQAKKDAMSKFDDETKGLTGFDILTKKFQKERKTNGQLTKVYLHDYLKKLAPNKGNLNQVIDKGIELGDLDDEAVKILNKRYKAMFADEDAIEGLNKALAAEIEKYSQNLLGH